nr:hypothetical protein [Tanacetum cinerariifolium]GEY65725.1 hypothetical protein [Tanacetum cinerariifolium]
MPNLPVQQLPTPIYNHPSPRDQLDVKGLSKDELEPWNELCGDRITDAHERGITIFLQIKDCEISTPEPEKMDIPASSEERPSIPV